MRYCMLWIDEVVSLLHLNGPAHPPTHLPIHTQGLSSLVSSTALALLRSSSSWVSAAGESQHFSGKGGESEYSRLAIRERSKFEKVKKAHPPTHPPVPTASYLPSTLRRAHQPTHPSTHLSQEVNMMAGRSAASSPYLVDSRPTLSVVTLCVAIRGKSTKINGSLNSAAKLREALQVSSFNHPPTHQNP